MCNRSMWLRTGSIVLLWIEKFVFYFQKRQGICLVEWLFAPECGLSSVSVVYISEVGCAAVYGLHFVKCIKPLWTNRDRQIFDDSFNALTRRLVGYNSTAERRGHHLVSWFQSVWRVIVHDMLLVNAVTHRYVNIAAKLRKRTRLLGHLAFGLLPAWCCNPMARLSAGRKWQSCFCEWFTTRGSRSVCAVYRTITRHCT